MISNKPTPAGRQAERALREAVSAALERHRKLGLPVAVMKNGKAVLVSVQEAIRITQKKRRARK